MRSLFKYIFLVVFAFLWYLGGSEKLTKWLYENKFIQDEYRYGDLYRLSNLANFKSPLQKCPTPVASTPQAQNLYILGDSFTEKERISKNSFKGIANYSRFFIGDTTFVRLDKSKKNILLIETVERHFRERFSMPYLNLQVGKKNIKVQKEEENLWQKVFNYEVPYNTQRHEAILFSSDFFLQFKEWKAWLNWKLFDRIDDKVMLSRNGKYLFYQLDAQPSGINSSFDKISEKDIEAYVANVNQTFDYYKKIGFDEVYLSIIPNKSAIYGTDLGEYNHLIERIQQNKQLKMPFIDTYTPFKNTPKMMYEIGDSHWNCEGQEIWVDAVNRIL